MSDQETEVRPTSPISHTNTIVEENMESLREKYTDPDLWAKTRVGETEISWPQPRSALLSMREFSTISLETLEEKFSEKEEEQITVFLRYIKRIKQDEELLQPMEQLLAQLATVENPQTQLEDMSLLQTRFEKQSLRAELEKMERVRTGLLDKSQSLFSVTRKQRMIRKNDFNETIKSTLDVIVEEGYWETRRFLLGKAELLQLKVL